MDAYYDSKVDTLVHIRKVGQLLNLAAIELMKRGNVHDNSKLEEPEKNELDQYTPLLKRIVFGSKEYKNSLAILDSALQHHYKKNTHHPEHYEDGISGFDLFDLIEMYFDWKASCERTQDGNILKSIEYNKSRFGLSDQIVSILKNTAIRYNW